MDLERKQAEEMVGEPWSRGENPAGSGIRSTNSLGDAGGVSHGGAETTATGSTADIKTKIRGSPRTANELVIYVLF